MRRSETKKAKRQKTKNVEEIDAIINKILRKKITITEAVKNYDISYSFINKKIASIKNPDLNKTYNQTEAVGKYDVAYSIKNKKLASIKNPNINKINKELASVKNPDTNELNKELASIKNPDIKKTYHETCVFTKEQELILRDHIIKCCKSQYGVTNTTIRKMAYEYAIKLPNCNYPKNWDAHEMASVAWFFKFRSRYPGLKKALTKKFQHTCICIMGCHMGPEGKQVLKKLEAKVLIARVYHYLQREYEYMKMCNDLGLLVNILRRTAEATGVCEQTITKILDEEKRATSELHDIVPGAPKEKKKKETIMMEHNYSNGVESSNTEAVDEDSSSSNYIQYSDFERLQQNATFIKSVKVEILDDDVVEQDDQQNNEDEPMKVDLIVDEPSDKPTQGSTIDVPVTVSKTKSNAQKCKDYREKEKLNTPKEKKTAKSRAQINKNYYEKHKISISTSHSEYMKKYRQKKKLEKQSLKLKQIQQQNDNQSRNIHSRNEFEPPRKKYKTKVYFRKREKNKDVRHHNNNNMEDSASQSEFQAIASVVNQRSDNHDTENIVKQDFMDIKDIKQDDQNNEDEPMKVDSIDGEPSESDTHETETKVKIDSIDIKHNKLDDNLHVEGNTIRIIFTDDETDKHDLYRDTEDTAISIDYTEPSKPNSSDTQEQVTITSDGDGDFEGELVIDESQLSFDYNAVDRRAYPSKAKAKELTERSYPSN